MKLRCTILDDYQQVAMSMADWSSITQLVDVNVMDHHIDAQDDLVDVLKDSNIVVIMRERTTFTASLLDRLPQLKLLLTTGKRNASIDLQAATNHGITVCGTDGSSLAASELTWDRSIFEGQSNS